MSSSFSDWRLGSSPPYSQPRPRILRFIPFIILFPALDIALTILLARNIPRPVVLLWIAASCLAGGFLILSIRKGLRHPRPMALDLALAARQLVRLVTGLLLLFPGPLSDILAALLVFPRSRQKLTAWVLSRTIGISPITFDQSIYERHRSRDPGEGALRGPLRKDGYVRDAEFEVVNDGGEAPPEPEERQPGATKPKD